jgi:hypothetical protein
MKLATNDKSLDSIKLQSGELLFVLTFDGLEQGIVPFIQQFGNLYYGHLNLSSFKQIYSELKRNLVKKLITIDQITEETVLETVEFGLHLCQSVVKPPQWNYPATVTRWNQELRWNTGKNRLLATGITGIKNPHTYLKILCLEQADKNINDFLDCPTHITSDRQLNEIFGLNYDNNRSHRLVLNTRLLKDTTGHSLWLEIVSDGEKYNIEKSGKLALSKYQQWREKYGRRPELHVYTDWPEMLHNTQNAWNVVHAGPSYLKPVERPGFLERQIKFNVFENSHPFAEIYPHTLFIVEPSKINLEELLFYINLDHTMYIGNDYKYLLYRPDTHYESCFITTSCFD